MFQLLKKKSQKIILGAQKSQMNFVLGYKKKIVGITDMSGKFACIDGIYHKF